jgi:CobQ-like glutamine amidotransferase family enzyme
MSDVLRICALYPSRMNIYADRGNMILLQKRCEARGIGFELTAVEDGESIDPAAHDFFYIGGGQDSDQVQIAEDMVKTKREAMAAAADDGKVILAVCGGYQLLGEYYEIEHRKIEGLGIVDLRTVREPGERLIGNVMIEFDVDGSPQVLAGFENHGGRTYLGGSAKPLGEVLHGFGNNGNDSFEGVRRDNVFGTYLHGPLLPKNSWFADHLTSLALGGIELEPLPDELEEMAHASAIRAASSGFASKLHRRR